MLTRETVRSALLELEAVLPHAECRTCECLQGLVAQFRLDAPEDAETLIRPWLVQRGQVHSCLGCDPCPPGDRFAAYLRHMNDSRQQPIIIMRV